MSPPEPLGALAATALRVAHHLPGRIRLKLAGNAMGPALVAALDDARRGAGLSQRAARAAAEAAAQDSRLDALSNALPGVRSLRVNKLARSCTVEYDAAVIPPAAWEDWLAGRRTPAAGLLEGVVAAALQSVLAAAPAGGRP